MNGSCNSVRQNSRRTLFASDLIIAEEIQALPELPPSGCTTTPKFVITFSGAFEFKTARSVSWVDPSRLLLVQADREFADRHVVPGVGHQSVVLTPAVAVLDELAASAQLAFTDALRSCSLRVQMLSQLMRRTRDPMAAEELGIATMSAALGNDHRVGPSDPHCVRKAKLLLHSRPSERWTLTNVASLIGVSPVYLTQLFKRTEGVPLYRYQLRMRLGRALAELPDCDDITNLALELGFSSHSHFTAAFRSAVGLTPSVFRSRARAG